MSQLDGGVPPTIWKESTAEVHHRCPGRAHRVVLVILSLCAALGYGVSDFAGGLAARRIRPMTALLYGEPAGALLVVAVLPFFPGHLSWHTIVFAGAAGLAGMAGLGLMYQLMASEPLTIVAPVTAVLAAATPLMFGVLGGEHPNPLAWIGILLGLTAVALISGAPDGTGRRRVSSKVVLLALASGTGFGVYFVLVAQSGHGSGVLTLLVARLTAMSVLVPLAMRCRAAARPHGRTAASAVVAGLTDCVADICFLLATQAGYLSFAAVITALYPAVTVLLALLVLRERTGWLPCVGLVLSVASIALLTG